MQFFLQITVDAFVGTSFIYLQRHAKFIIPGKFLEQIITISNGQESPKSSLISVFDGFEVSSIRIQ